MPSLRNIQEFGQELKKVGNEPEILRRRGEAGEEATPANQPASSSAPGAEGGAPGSRAAASSTGAPRRSAAPSSQPPSQGAPEDLGEGVPSDIDALLASLGEDAATSGEAGGGVGEGAEVEAPEDSFLEDFLRQSDEAEETELTSLFEDTAASEPTPEEAFGESGAGQPEPPVGAGEPQRQAEAPGERAAQPAGGGEGSEEISDEELFFAVPSAEDLLPPDLAEEPAGGEAPEGGAIPETEPGPEFAPFGQGEPGAGIEGLAEAAAGAYEGLEGIEPPAEESALPGGPEPGSEEAGSMGDLGDFSELGIPEDFGAEEIVPPGVPEEAFEAAALPEGGAPAEETGPLSRASGGEGLGAIPATGEAGQPEGEPGSPPGEIGLPEEGGFEEFIEPEGPAPEAASEEGPAGAAASIPVRGAGAAEEAPPQAAATGSGGALPEDVGDFNLDDIGEQFGLSREEPVSEEELNPALAVGPGAPQVSQSAAAPPGASEAPAATAATAAGRQGGPEGAGPSIRLSNRDFQALQRTLAQLPRNLRIAVEELIGESELSGPQLEQLIGLLVRGASARAIADAAGRIIGRRIEIPVQYERKTGRELEEEIGTFAYRFRRNILPILRAFLVGAAVLALMVFLVYRFIYNPIHAYSVYDRGYGELQGDNFVQANADFSQASQIWEIKGWYYRYAQGFIERHQYSFAAAKYDALLSIWPADRKGIFDYADMESRIIGDYRKAEQLLNILLNENMYDFQALLAAGDNYLRWGATDPSMYEKARLDFATLIQRYGDNNEVLFRMMEYFIRTNNYPQVLQLEKYFQADKRIKVNPKAYAELGGYLIDKRNLTDVKDILFRALAVNPTLPEINFNLARYFHAIGDYSQESVALQKTLNFLLSTSPMSQRQLGMLLETYDMIGENYYRAKRYLDAQQAYTRGIDQYETALSRKLLLPAPQYGKLYADLGDLNYYISGNFNQALRLYQKAEQNGYRSSELKYKEGYVYYRNQDYKNALLSFYSAAGDFSDNRALLYATANTLFERNDYFAAEGYYLNLLNSLEQQRAQIANFQPDTVPADHALLVDLMKTYNNLGVAMNLLSKRSADANKYSQSLVELTRSMESFDQLTRNPITKIAPPSVNIAYLNMRGILYPTPDYKLQIYPDIPRDMTETSF